MTYTVNDKMSLFLQNEHEAIQLINRFHLPLGVGEKTIQQVCKEEGIDAHTFVRMANYISTCSARICHDLTRSEIWQKCDSATHKQPTDIATVMRYIKNGHTYFLDFQLPRIRQELISALGPILATNKVAVLIIRFYDEYVDEIRTHIEHENQNAFHLHKSDDRHIADKLSELKNLIIKFYPGKAGKELFTALHDISEIEEELKIHCAIEEDLLIPALGKDNRAAADRHKEPAEDGDEELSTREKEVLREVVNGLSNKEIADKLNISTHTVISHRKNITRKLDIHSVAGLTIYALVNGLVEL